MVYRYYESTNHEILTAFLKFKILFDTLLYNTVEVENRFKAHASISIFIIYLGGGCIAVAGDGGLRQWQVVNEVNHVAHVPYSFFAIKYDYLSILYIHLYNSNTFTLIVNVGISVSISSLPTGVFQ